MPSVLTGGRSYEDLKDLFMHLLLSDNEPVEIKSYSAPELYDINRVTYIIPPITDVEHRDTWKQSNVYIVKEGIVAIGRVSYTRTSGEFLIEELILRRGDIFGEFEVPLSIFGDSGVWGATLPPRFSMTYGAWASGPALNWAMAYPRHIPRDSVAPESAKLAVHPFYIKSKNIRPKTDAEVIIVPIEHFEKIVSTHPELMTWFLMNVLKKTRLYFEPPSRGYSYSSMSIISRFIIRILAHRIRLGIVTSEREGKRMSCRTFIGPTEWIKYGFGAYIADLKEIIQSTGNNVKMAHKLRIFPDELADILNVTYHFPVKDLDEKVLKAMGCSPEEDKRENRYGLLTGINIELADLDCFMNYLKEKGE